MADENKIQVKLGVDMSGLAAGMSAAKDAVTSGTDAMKSSLNGLGDAFGTLQKSMMGLTAIMAGGSLFASGVSATKELTGEVMSLSKALGISSQDSSVLNVALKSIGSSAEAYTGANQRLTRQLKTNETGLQAMGVVTRNANGELKNGQEIMTSAVEALKGYKEGTDRNLAAQELFGRGAAEATALMKLNNKVMEEAEVKAKALGLVIGSKQAAEVKAYKEAMEDVHLVMTGIKNTIGQAMIPVLTELAEWFSSTGPQRVSIMREAMDALKSTLLTSIEIVKEFSQTCIDVFSSVGELASTVGGTQVPGAMRLLQIAMETIKVVFLEFKVVAITMFTEVATTVKVLVSEVYRAGEIIGAALTLDWDNITDAWQQGTIRGEKIVAEGAAKIKKLMMETQAEIDGVLDHSGANFSNEGRGRKPPPKTGKNYTPPAATTPPPPPPKSEVGEWERINKEAKDSFEFNNDLKTRDLSNDVEFWQSKLALADTTNGDLLRVQEKLAAARLAVLKKETADGKALTEVAIATSEKTALDGLAAAKAAHDSEFAMGKITQAQLVALEQDAEDQKFQILKDHQQLRERLVFDDPNHTAAALQREKDKLLEIERAHESAVTAIKAKAAIDDMKYGKQFEDGMNSGFSSVIKNFAQGTMTIQSLFLNMGKAVLSALTDVFAQIAAKWLANKVMQQVGAKVSSMAQIMGSAAAAGAAAFASTAAIPIVGPELAPAAAAAAYSGASSFAAMPGFAVGAWNIPHDMLTKVHAGETILNATDSENFRNARKGGTSSGEGDGNMNVTIHAMDGASVQRVFMENSHILAKEMRRQHRNFAFWNAS